VIYRVLLITDGSPNAARAARTAADIARQSSGTVLTLYVIPPVPTLVMQTVSQGGAELADIMTALRSAIRTGQAALSQAANILDQDNISYTAQLEQGMLAQTIQQIVHKENCDAVVISRQGLDRATVLGAR
jgi:nucleotide-binding universal stress UspA family protein